MQMEIHILISISVRILKIISKLFPIIQNKDNSIIKKNFSNIFFDLRQVFTFLRDFENFCTTQEQSSIFLEFFTISKKFS